MAPGPHPRRELTLMPRLGSPYPRLGMAAGAGCSHDSRPVASVGRQARLHLRFACRAGRTTLVHAYAEPPFRVGRCFAAGDGVHMIMATTAPGVFGGDCLEQRIHLEAGTSVRLTSQSSLQV